MRHPDGAMLVSTLVAAPRAAAGRALRRAAWDWAGLPSGPLGWVSSRTVLASAPTKKWPSWLGCWQVTESVRSRIAHRCLSVSRQRLWPLIRWRQFSAGM
jgi:hypothetical protein